MVDVRPYGLRDMPFLAIPAINIDSSDIRINGRLFCREIAEEAFGKLRDLILTDSFPMVFVRSPRSVLGNGKSAFMAAVYWELYDQGKNLLWAQATSNPRIRDLLVKILDSLVKERKLRTLREGLTPLNEITIENALAARSQKVGPETIHAVFELLRAKEHELTYVYTNIRRRIPGHDQVELFGAFMELLYGAKMPRFTIFIDQFEEYVRSHRSMSERRKMADELNDLQRKIGESTTLVVSTHPEAEGILTGSPEFERFIKIEQTSVELPSYGEEDLMKMIKFYLRTYRLDSYKGGEFDPFDEDVIRYAIHRTSMVSADMVIALRAALIYGSLEKASRIDGDFLMKHHKDMFGGLDNKWSDFKSGKFRYTVE